MYGALRNTLVREEDLVLCGTFWCLVKPFGAIESGSDCIIWVVDMVVIVVAELLDCS